MLKKERKLELMRFPYLFQYNHKVIFYQYLEITCSSKLKDIHIPHYPSGNSNNFIKLHTFFHFFGQTEAPHPEENSVHSARGGGRGVYNVSILSWHNTTTATISIP